MIGVLVTIFAALMGLAFGSFLNVCVTRWPEGESVVAPRSHCRSCGRTLSWHENVPLLSWLALRGRCRGCGAWIGWRYPLVECAVAVTWALITWQTVPALAAPDVARIGIFSAAFYAVDRAVLCWLLIGLGALDAEHFWLPDRLTLGGALLGLPFALIRFATQWFGGEAAFRGSSSWLPAPASAEVLRWIIGLIVAPGIILFTRWAYQLVRHREGIGLGDAKLMLLLAVWLGLLHTLLAFVLGVICGTVLAFVVLLVPASRRESGSWALTRLPLGTCLCAGGIVSALYGAPLIQAYLRAAGIM